MTARSVTQRPMPTLPDEWRRIVAMIVEQFAEMLMERLSEPYRAGRIVKLILDGAHIELRAIVPETRGDTLGRSPFCPA